MFLSILTRFRTLTRPKGLLPGGIFYINIATTAPTNNNNTTTTTTTTTTKNNNN